MQKSFEKYKGIHPGAIIGRELAKRKLKQRPFALSIMEHPQTFNSIIKGKRDLPLATALKIERALGLEEGTLALLQTYFDIEREKKKYASMRRPDLSRLRTNLFWDTDVNTIDWERQAKAVIKRVFERGNFTEKKHITQFYGVPKVKSIMDENIR